MNEFYDSLETRSSDERAAAQLALLRDQVEHARNNTRTYADTLEDIIQEMLLTNSSERQGRTIDRDQSASMEKKKQEGYF